MRTKQENEHLSRGSMICFRLYKFMSYNHISGTALAKEMGVSPQSVSNMLRKGMPFSDKVAQAWVKGFANLGYQVNTDWLVSGEEPITGIPEHDPSLIAGYEKASSDKRDTIHTTSFELKKVHQDLLNLRGEYERLLEKHRALKAENADLKQKLSAIRRIAEA